MKIYKNLFAEIVSPDNLFAAWSKFRLGKSRKEDVAAFEFELEQNILKLQRELADKSYRHGRYTGFYRPSNPFTYLETEDKGFRNSLADG